eukprot:TRINITY_DN4502_c1_g1_i1.p1 TRINITY_DN4502_c1_g1~~TRINITY_DN4502_c1_g1_i1.p1  ORF type:complete len:178 (+),score=26.09 TRINITY_DN4502_c1_g1_i1:398-931(+)
MVVGCVPPSGGGIGGVDGAAEGAHDALLMEDSDSSGGSGTPMTVWERGADRSGSVTTGNGTAGGSGGVAPFRYAHLVHERNADGGYRYCNKCASFKPDRTHHCRRCGFCVQKMDHDCVFVSNCVGRATTSSSSPLSFGRLSAPSSRPSLRGRRLSASSRARGGTSAAGGRGTMRCTC